MWNLGGRNMYFTYEMKDSRMKIIFNQASQTVVKFAVIWFYIKAASLNTKLKFKKWKKREFCFHWYQWQHFTIVLQLVSESYSEIYVNTDFFHVSLTLPKSTVKCWIERDLDSHLRDKSRSSQHFSVDFGRVRLSWKKNSVLAASYLSFLTMNGLGIFEQENSKFAQNVTRWSTATCK